MRPVMLPRCLLYNTLRLVGYIPATEAVTNTSQIHTTPTHKHHQQQQQQQQRCVNSFRYHLPSARCAH
uniref:Putative secreted protein n=1 Tax=Anopheles marajoara TaxID=58244 RepID=A0A2M4CFB4_9DIPT